MRPCIQPNCHRLTKQTRCPQHQQPHNTTKNRQPHRTQHQKRTTHGPATQTAQQTNATCTICGQHQQPPQAKRNRWHWHHTQPGNPNSPQQLAHEHCNTSYGNGP